MRNFYTVLGIFSIWMSGIQFTDFAHGAVDSMFHSNPALGLITLGLFIAGVVQLRWT